MGRRLRRCGGFSLDTLVGLAGASFFFFLDQVAELGLCVAAGLLVFGLLGVVGRLCLGEVGGFVGGLVSLIGEPVVLVVEVRQGVVELVGGGGAAGRGDPDEVVTLQ